MANHRMERVNEEMKKELANIFQNEIRDPRVTAMISVTGVAATQDLKYAKVYLSLFGVSREEEVATLKALKDMRSFIRKRLSATLNLRNTPELTFLQDTTIQYGMHMDELVKEVRKKDEEIAKAAQEYAQEEPTDLDDEVES